MYQLRKLWHNFAKVDNEGSEGSVTELTTHLLFSYGNVQDGEVGGAGGVVAIGNAADYSVDGDVYQLAASSTNWDCRGFTNLVGTAPHQLVAFCADSSGATTPTQGVASTTAALAATAENFPSIPEGSTCIAYVVLDVSHLTTTEEYAWDQDLSSHGTYHNGLTRDYLFLA